MPSIAEEKTYERRIAFYAERVRTCGYRFYDMIQTRAKEVPRLDKDSLDENTKQ